MTGRQRAILAIVFVVAVIGGGVLVIALSGGFGAPTPTGNAPASPTAAASPSNATAGATSSAASSASPSAEVSSAPSASPSAPPTQTPTLTPTKAPQPPATITFTQLKLDAQDDPAGQDRVITFRSQGSGQVTAALTSLSPQSTTRMCLSIPTKALGCKSTAAGQLTATTTAPTADFTLTLRGVAIDTPTIQVAISFPADQASVTIANARFDGTAFPDTNGIRAVVTPRADGDVRLQAEWGGHPFQYEVHLTEQGGPGSQAITDAESATKVDATLPLTGTNSWLLSLANAESGFGVTGLQATITWP